MGHPLAECHLRGKYVTGIRSETAQNVIDSPNNYRVDMRKFLVATIIEILISLQTVDAKERARDLGIPFGGTPGARNAIVDVPGVEVGHATILRKPSVRTGVTAIFPQGKRAGMVPGAWFAFNGNGEMTGTAWIDESGFLEGPVMTTNTYAIGVVHDAVRKWAQKKFPNNDPDVDDAIMLPVVAETWDGQLNDINGFHVSEADTVSALESASTTNTDEGSVGGGTGMVCFQYKCGIGTSSRRIVHDNKEFVVGVLVQANFGSRAELKLGGKLLGPMLADDHLPDVKKPETKDGSIVAVLATNVPLLPHQLKRVAKRMVLGTGLTGAIGHNSSGDLFVAFSTVRPKKAKNGEVWLTLSNESLDEVFRAAVQATEESIANALVAGETMVGVRGQRVYGISHERLKNIFKK